MNFAGEFVISPKIEINESILKEIGSVADKFGYEIYVVGGFVRDYFLGRERKDYDITVVGDSLEFAKKVAEHFNSHAVIYERFKTAMVPVGGFQVEFVGTRKEEYLPDSRKPMVTEGNLVDDLKRRDFTVNAMAASLNSEKFGELIDLFGGMGDLGAAILRTPLDPAATFSDDPLRMMRAARFASQLGFKIEESCFEEMKNMADRIKIISQERISDEFFKILDSPNPNHGIAILFTTGLLKITFPELDSMAGVEIVNKGEKNFAHKDVFWHSLKVLENISKVTSNRWLRFAALVHDIAKPRTKKFIEGIGWSFHGH